MNWIESANACRFISVYVECLWHFRIRNKMWQLHYVFRRCHSELCWCRFFRAISSTKLHAQFIRFCTKEKLTEKKKRKANKIDGNALHWYNVSDKMAKTFFIEFSCVCIKGKFYYDCILSLAPVTPSSQTNSLSARNSLTTRFSWRIEWKLKLCCMNCERTERKFY